MNKKQWIGAALIALGIFALILSHSIRGRVAGEMGEVNFITSPLSKTGAPGNIVSNLVSERAGGEAEQYLKKAEFLMVGGVILIIMGGCLIFLYKKKKR
ncbi:MAG TPA: hypothetical protein VLE95_02710 [Chlamydiales bacterium]|nr:hypothetical protein [Chlamydiales bacterium]